MKFWIVEGPGGEMLGCETSKRKALEFGASLGVPREDLRAFWIEVDVTAENVRRLLGGHGGYAKAQEQASL